jgi:hypothetical protein
MRGQKVTQKPSAQQCVASKAKSIAQGDAFEHIDT